MVEVMLMAGILAHKVSYAVDMIHLLVSILVDEEMIGMLLIPVAVVDRHCF